MKLHNYTTLKMILSKIKYWILTRIFRRKYEISHDVGYDHICPENNENHGFVLWRIYRNGTKKIVKKL